MSGRPAQKIYEYNFSGEYLRSYNSIQEARQKYYSDDTGQRPIFVKKELGEEYHITFEDTILLKNRIGRDNIKYLLNVVQSEYYNLSTPEDRPIQVFNIMGELLAEFPSAYIATKMMPHLSHLIYTQLRVTGRERRSKRGSDLTFKYKE